jgi:hypothetical protein
MPFLAVCICGEPILWDARLLYQNALSDRSGQDDADGQVMMPQSLLGRQWMSAREPSEGPLDEWLRVFLDADTMRDDELVEVPRKQLFKRLSCQISIPEVSLMSSGTPPCGLATPSSVNTASSNGLPFTLG